MAAPSSGPSSVMPRAPSPEPNPPSCGPLHLGRMVLVMRCLVVGPESLATSIGRGLADDQRQHAEERERRHDDSPSFHGVTLLFNIWLFVNSPRTPFART